MKSDPKAAELVLRNIKKVPDIHADINLLHFEENRQCLVGDILHSYGPNGNMRLLNNIDKSCNIMILNDNSNTDIDNNNSRLYLKRKLSLQKKIVRNDLNISRKHYKTTSIFFKHIVKHRKVSSCYLRHNNVDIRNPAIKMNIYTFTVSG